MPARGFAPWWLAGALLGAVTVLHWVFLRRLLGVSGILQRLTFLAESRARERAEALAPTGAELEAALLAETAAEFGPEAIAAAGLAAGAGAPPPDDAAARSDAGPSLGACAAFVVAIAAGGALSAALRGTLSLEATLGPGFERLFGGAVTPWAVLVAGGFAVGVGTSLAGGCSSGHGLSGCSRLQPGSLLATACFVAAAIATSLVLAAGGLG